MLDSRVKEHPFRSRLVASNSDVTFAMRQLVTEVSYSKLNKS